MLLCCGIVFSKEEELLDEAVCSLNYVNLWTCLFCKNFTSLSTRKKCNCQGYVLVVIPADTKIPMASGEIDFSGVSSPLLPVLLYFQTSSGTFQVEMVRPACLLIH